MSVHVWNAALERSRSKGAARLVLLALADQADDDGTITRSVQKRSQSFLAQRANVDRVTVTRALAALVELGELEVLVRGGGRTESDYRIVLEQPSHDESPHDLDEPEREPPQQSRDDTRAVADDTPSPRTALPQPSSSAEPILPCSRVTRESRVSHERADGARAPEHVAATLAEALTLRLVEPPAARQADLVQAVFLCWCEATDRNPNRTKLDDKRRRVIERALRDYPPEDVRDAVRGWRHSPHHTGQNDSGTTYNDLTLLLRDSAHLERFRDLERRGPERKPQARARSADALDELRRRAAVEDAAAAAQALDVPSVLAQGGAL